MNKYPRTYHFDFSPEVHSDDKVQYDISNLINNEIVVLYKLDGGNTTINKNGVYARSINEITKCETFDYIKNIHFFNKKFMLEDNLNYHGENMYAKHSIYYDKLTDYFYLFGISDKNKFLNWDKTLEKAKELNFKVVPTLFRGTVKSKEELKVILEKGMKLSCPLGGNSIEGFVVRTVKEFNKKDFSYHVVKYVRKGHVQTDEHWSKNWIKNKLLNF